MKKKILIIGAGIAGLSAGIHACRNGYETKIYEMHNAPGGLCTAWERKGFTFDGCIHYLYGTKPGSQFNHLWQELGALDEADIFDGDPFMRIECREGGAVNVYSNLDKLEEHLLDHSPADAPVIGAIVNAAKAFSRINWPLEKPQEFNKIWHLPLMLFQSMPLFKIMGQFSRVSIEAYLEQLNSPLLKEALGLIIPKDYSMLSLISTLASLHNKDAGFPRGGSLKLSRSIEKYFLDMGGEIAYNSRVNEILVENGRTTGLLLEDGSKIYGDVVISAADLHHTAYNLLRGKFLTPLIKKSFSELPTYSSVLVFLGVDADLGKEDYSVALKLDEPIALGDEHNHYLYLTNYSFDPTLAPPGKTVIRASLFSSYGYWEKNAKNKAVYRGKKEQLLDRVVQVVEKRYPAAANRIETSDVATPYSFKRYTNVYKGAYMGWLVPPDSGRLRIPKQLPGLENFYQIGQWIEPPAGLPGSMLTGRHVVQLICRADRKAFQSL